MPRRHDRERLIFRRCDRQNHRAADAWRGVRTIDAVRVALVGVPGLDVDVVRGLVDRAGPHQVHAVAAGRDRAARVPERNRVLHRLGRHRDRREVVELRVLAADLAGGEGVADDSEDVDEAVLRLRPVAAEPVVLDRRHAATDTEVEAAVGEVVDHAHVFDDLHRVVQRQQLDHRAEADVLRDLRSGSDEHLLVRCHAQIRPVVLGEVEAGEPGFVGHLDQIEPILEQLRRRRAGNVLDVVEDAERWFAHQSLSFSAPARVMSLHDRATSDDCSTTSQPGCRPRCPCAWGVLLGGAPPPPPPPPGWAPSFPPGSPRGPGRGGPGGGPGGGQLYSF